MRVPFYNFAKLHHAEFQKEILERFKEIVATNTFVEGKYNTQFEAEFAELQGAKHCLLLANGTDAIEIALQAHDIGHGDKVGVAAISFFASAEAVINRGAEVVFIDVDPKTGLIDPASLKKMLEVHKLKAIIPVHIYGLPAPIEELEKICKPLDIKIIEDGAQSQGGYYTNKKPIGSSNNIVTYSFYPTKNLGAFGDAGAVTAPTQELKDTMMSIRNHGRSPKGHALIGRNSRCDHMQAAVLQLKLRELNQQNEARKEIAKKYLESLAHLPVRLLDKKWADLSSWHLFPIGVESEAVKLKLRNHLTEKGIGSALFYEKSLPQEKPIQHCEGERKNADHFALTTFTIPMNPFLTDEDIALVSKEIENFFKNN
ncbi:MAG: DegT/DnrJ/EryC1/StrS family aminotransferase [Bacteriovoracaceae bacterium]|nr:DegT/DnrJ/EryC1/StrS family aminotransferase [Bacteriovoracaceae bacterium]